MSWADMGWNEDEPIEWEHPVPTATAPRGREAAPRRREGAPRGREAPMRGGRGGRAPINPIRGGRGPRPRGVPITRVAASVRSPFTYSANSQATASPARGGRGRGGYRGRQTPNAAIPFAFPAMTAEYSTQPGSIPAGSQVMLADGSMMLAEKYLEDLNAGRIHQLASFSFDAELESEFDIAGLSPSAKSNKFIEDCSNIFVVHNLEQFGPVNHLEISKRLRSILFGPTDAQTFVLVVLFEKEDVQLGFDQLSIKGNKNKKNQKKKSKSKRQIAITKETKLRKKAFNNIFLHCTYCNSKKVYQAVRHRENEREFSVFPFVSNSDALKRLLIRVQALPPSVPVTIFGPSDIIGSRVQKDLPDRNITCSTSFAEPHNPLFDHTSPLTLYSKELIISQFEQSVGNITLLNSSGDSFDSDGDAVFSDFRASSDSFAGDENQDINKWYVDIATARVANWANRQTASLPKTIQKLENSVKNLLKVQLPDSLKQKIIRNIIFQLAPCDCGGCGSFALSNLLPSAQSKKIDLEDSYLPIYKNAVQLLSKIDQLPNTVNGLANVLANCFSPVQVDFKSVYENLRKKKFIIEDENDSTVIHFK